MAKKFKLKKEYMNGGDVYLGGHRDNQPDRVKLDADNPYVEGDEYEIYVGSILREVPEDPSVEEKADAIKKFASKFSSGDVAEDEPEKVEPEEVDEPEDESADVDTQELEEDELEEVDEDELDVDDLLSEFESADEPQVDEGEELTLDSEEEDDGEPLPEPSELDDMNRSELEALALQMGVLDDIEGSGSGGYITVADFNEYLAPLLEEASDE